MFATFVLGVRAMAVADWPGLATGGPPWVADLTARAVDTAAGTAPLGLAGGILPAAIVGLTLVTAAAGPGRAAAAAAGTPAGATASLVRLAVEWCAVPAAVGALLLPQGAALYWAASSLAALAQGAVVRRWVGVKATPPPSSPSPHLAAAARARAAGDVPAAIAAAVAATAARPGDARAWYALGQLRAGVREWGAAGAAYARCAELEANPGLLARARFGEGVAASMAGEREAAVECFGAAADAAETAAGGLPAAAAAAAAARTAKTPPPPAVATLARARLARAAALADAGDAAAALPDARAAAALDPGAAAYVAELVRASEGKV